MKMLRTLFFMIMAVSLPSAPGGLLAQETLSLGPYGEVFIIYMLVSEQYPMGIQISSLPDNEVDVTQNPDAELRIKVKVQEIKYGYRIYICPDCVPYQLNGFSRERTSKPYLDAPGESYSAYYRFDENYIGEGYSSMMQATLYVQEDGYTVGNESGYNSRGEAFRLKAGPASRQPREVTDIQKESNPMPSEPGPTDYDKIAWKETVSCAEREQAINQKITCYQEYLKQYNYGKYADEARERINYWQDEGKKWMASARREKEDVPINDGEENSDIEKEPQPASPAPAYSMSVSCQMDEEQNLRIVIEGGAPPFELRLFNGMMVSNILPLGEQSEMDIPYQAISSRVPPGEYRLQVFDSSGHPFPEAECMQFYLVGGDGPGAYLLPLVILAGVIAFFYTGYHFGRRKRH